MRKAKEILRLAIFAQTAMSRFLIPDLHIATLASGARLHMRIFAKRGRGYVQADRNKRDDQPIGVIPVDSIYTPITRVTTVLKILASVK